MGFVDKKKKRVLTFAEFVWQHYKCYVQLVALIMFNCFVVYDVQIIVLCMKKKKIWENFTYIFRHF